MSTTAKTGTTSVQAVAGMPRQAPATTLTRRHGALTSRRNVRSSTSIPERCGGTIDARTVACDDAPLDTIEAMEAT